MLCGGAGVLTVAEVPEFCSRHRVAQGFPGQGPQTGRERRFLLPWLLFFPFLPSIFSLGFHDACVAFGIGASVTLSPSVVDSGGRWLVHTLDTVSPPGLDLEPQGLSVVTRGPGVSSLEALTEQWKRPGKPF